jgi:hypothetical protein
MTKGELVEHNSHNWQHYRAHHHASSTAKVEMVAAAF